MIKGLIKSVSLAAALGLFGSSQAHATFFLDAFDSAGANTASITLIAPAVKTTTKTDTGLTNVLGGARTVKLDLQLSTFATDQVNFTVSPTDSIASYRSSDGADGNLLLTYDGNGAGLDVDFTGEQVIIVRFSAFDRANSNNLPVTVTLTDTSNNTFSLLQNLTVAINPVTDPPVDLGFLLSAYSGAGVNLAHIKSAKVDFTANIAHDFSMQFIVATTVPEPTTFLAALSALPLLGFVAYRKRHPKVA